MEAFRRSNLSSSDTLPNLRHVLAVRLLAPEPLHCPSARPSHDRVETVPGTMQFVKMFNADDSLSSVFIVRYMNSSNPFQGKNAGSNPGIATIFSLAPFR